jgi:hypothetical protein
MGRMVKIIPGVGLLDFQPVHHYLPQPFICGQNIMLHIDFAGPLYLAGG